MSEQKNEEPKKALDHVVGVLKAIANDRDIGAFVRLGHHEIGQALHPAGVGVQPAEITGIFGNPTQSEISRESGPSEYTLEQLLGPRTQSESQSQKPMEQDKQRENERGGRE